jgi:rod shape-determining protein MreC
MRGLLQYLANNSSTFIFFMLEAVCFYLIVRFNDSQRNIFFTTTNSFTGYLLKETDDLTHYFSLKTENEALQAENSELRKWVQKYARMYGDSLLYDTVRTGDLSQLFRDSSLQDSVMRGRFTFIPAHVIDNSISVSDNVLTLDRGSADGVETHMGVITGDGVVGIVRQVSEHYCTVLSLLHRQTRISASIRRNGYFGTLKWGGTDPNVMQLDAIPKHAEVKIRDTIETSGYSNIFPKGILIGKVEKWDLEEGKNFFDITVALNNDLGKVQSVYIVAFDDRKDFQKLQPKTPK